MVSLQQDQPQPLPLPLLCSARAPRRILCQASTNRVSLPQGAYTNKKKKAHPAEVSVPDPLKKKKRGEKLTVLRFTRGIGSGLVHPRYFSKASSLGRLSTYNWGEHQWTNPGFLEWTTKYPHLKCLSWPLPRRLAALRIGNVKIYVLCTCTNFCPLFCSNQTWTNFHLSNHRSRGRPQSVQGTRWCKGTCASLHGGWAAP